MKRLQEFENRKWDAGRQRTPDDAGRRTMFEIGPKRSETLVGILCSSWRSKTLVGNHLEDFEL